jgi:hypothetical protein
MDEHAQWDHQEFSLNSLCLFGNTGEIIAAVTHLYHRHAAGMPLRQFLPFFIQN